MPTAAVRKTVTVLFCDLVDSTELGERLDPESLRGVMSRWYEAMRAPIERNGGTVEKFVGDAVMAVFGVPRVHEDDALRAVRAAAELRERLERLNDELVAEHRPRLDVRIGLNTGEIVTGDGTTTLVTGDAVNTAKRLEEAARPGEILIGGTTRQLVESAVLLEAADAVRAKGKRSLVEAWRVLATIRDAPPFARRLDAPLVGRAAELSFLHEQLAVAEEEHACRLVTLLAAAGIGKSRLAAELAADVGERATVLRARCLPYGDGVTFWPVTQLVHDAGGPEAVETAVAGEPDADLIRSRIASVCDRSAPPVSTEETFWAIRRLAETLGRRRPVVVVLEDLHWAEPTFLDLVEYLAGWSRDATILLLCLARPELLDARPHWGGRTLTLEPLTDSESQELLDELGSEWPITARARARIVDAAEGNPLFLEQMVAMVGEGEDTLSVPPTIQALLAARLDRLEPLERAMLERASVAGREFSSGAVADLSPPDERPRVSTTLLSLVRKELVRPAPSPAVGADGYRFRHALIRDATYAGIAKRDRIGLHQRFAACLEADDGEDELVGYHLEQAYRYRADLGERDEALGERAGELLGAAGMRAGALGDAAAARSLLRRSLGLLPPPHSLRVELLQELSRALWLDGDVDGAELTLSEAIDVARSTGDTRLEWYGRLELAARNAATHGETAPMVRTAEKAIAVFEQLGDDVGLARAWRRLALVAHTERRYAAAATAAEQALAHAERGGSDQERARSADILCTALLFGPAPVEEAIDRAEAILASSKRNVVLRAHVSTTLAGLMAMRGDVDRARRLAADAGTVYDELGLRLPRVGWTEVVALVELLAGDPAAAIDALQSGYDVLDAGGFDNLRTFQAALLAFVLASDGQAAAAREFCRIADTAPDDDSKARLRAAQALLASAEGDAERLAREAVAFAERTDDLNLQANVRLTLARVLGDQAEAEAARRLFEVKGNVAAAAGTGLWSLKP
jgi:class 3 adenylate cyclase/tetratricopeptide (TPR) repeat protein